MIILRNVTNKIKKYDKTFFFFNSLQSLGNKIVFYLKNYHAQRTGLRLVTIILQKLYAYTYSTYLGF